MLQLLECRDTSLGTVFSHFNLRNIFGNFDQNVPKKAKTSKNKKKKNQKKKKILFGKKNHTFQKYYLIQKFEKKKKKTVPRVVS